MRLLLLAITLFFILSCSTSPIKQKIAVPPASSQEKSQIKKIESLYKKGRYTKTLSLLSSLIRKKDNSEIYFRALFIKGRILLKRRNYQKASLVFLQISNSPFYFSQEVDSLYLAAFSKFHEDSPDFKIIESLCLRVLENRQLYLDLEIKTLKLLSQVYKDRDIYNFFEIIARLKKLEKKPMYDNVALYRLNQQSLEVLENISDDRSRFQDVAILASLELGKYYWNLNDFNKARYFLDRVLSYSENLSYTQRAEDILSRIQGTSRAKPYNIGVILPLSGKNSSYGKRALRGLQLGLGIYGSPERSSFSLLVKDSESEAGVAESRTHDLIEESQPIAVVGGLLGKTSTQIAKVSQSFLTPNITFSQKSNLTKNNPSVFRYALTSHKIVERLVSVSMKKKGFKKFAILYPNDKYGSEYANLFWDEVERQGGEVVAIQTYDPKTPYFHKSIRRLTGTFYIEDRLDEYKIRLKNWYAEQPRLHSRLKVPKVLTPLASFDALFLPDSAQSLIEVAATLKHQDIKGITFLGTNLWNTKKLISQGKDLVEDSIFVDLAFDKNLFQQTGFYKLYRRTFGLTPTFLESQAYDVGLILRQLILSGAQDKESLSQKLLKLSEFPGTLGLVSTSQSRDILHELKILTLKDGQIVSLF